MTYILLLISLSSNSQLIFFILMGEPKHKRNQKNQFSFLSFKIDQSRVEEMKRNNLNSNVATENSSIEYQEKNEYETKMRNYISFLESENDILETEKSDLLERNQKLQDCNDGLENANTNLKSKKKRQKKRIKLMMKVLNRLVSDSRDISNNKSS